MIFDELWRAQRERRKTNKTFDRLIDKAKKQKNLEERESLISELFMERDIINDKINWIETRRLEEKAEKFGVPIPPLSDKESWEEGYAPNTVRLRREARIRITDQIRKERRARIDDRMLWVERLAPLTGLVGAVIGLIATLRSCR